MSGTVQEILRDMEGLRDSLHKQVTALDAAILSLKEGIGMPEVRKAAFPPFPTVVPVYPPRSKSPMREKRRDLGDTSLELLKFVAQNGETSILDVREYAEENLGLDNYDALRSRMAGFVNNGLLFRVKKGIYRITPTGAKKSGPIQNEGAPSESREAPSSVDYAGLDPRIFE